jgi:catabolite regulation protein CreA
MVCGQLVCVEVSFRTERGTLRLSTFWASDINCTSSTIVISDHLEFNFLTVSQGSETFRKDGSLVYKVFSAFSFLDDKTISLLYVEPGGKNKEEGKSKERVVAYPFELQPLRANPL